MLEKILMFVCIVGSLFCIGLLIVIIVATIYPATLRYEEIPNISVKVEGKQYEEPYVTTSIIYAGKTVVPQTHYHDEEYNVYVSYEGETYCINDKSLYERVDINDNVYVCVHKGYNKKGEEKHIYLTAE